MPCLDELLAWAEIERPESPWEKGWQQARQEN